MVDLACGEGYGTAMLARTAASVVGVDANPEAFDHARAKYSAPNVHFERNMVELWQGDVDCVVFLQTIEHVPDPDGVLGHIKELIGPGGVAYVSTPNVLTLAPKGAERSGNPWHVREYTPEEYRALCVRHFTQVDLRGLVHARKLRAHQVAIERLGWDRVHAALHLTKPFYDRFTPAISASDFALRRDRLERSLDLLAVLRSRCIQVAGEGVPMHAVRTAACEVPRCKRAESPPPGGAGSGGTDGAGRAPGGESPPGSGVAQVFARARQLTP